MVKLVSPASRVSNAWKSSTGGESPSVDFSSIDSYKLQPHVSKQLVIPPQEDTEYVDPDRPVCASLDVLEFHFTPVHENWLNMAESSHLAQTAVFETSDC